MKFFLDTSAMVKLFTDEPGSTEMIARVEKPGTEIWVLDLAGLEFSSMVWRRARENVLSVNEASALLHLQEQQFDMWEVLAISPALLSTAKDLLREHAETEGLRTLDAIQLAGFSWLVEEEDCVFASADSRLCRVARGRGYSVFNPEESPSSDPSAS